jgi:NADH-quinone oxidoreductase subunit F
MTFEEIKNTAFSKWNEFYDKDKIHILVGSATCGRAAGALEVIDSIETELKKLNIDARVIQTGCIGACYLEPIVTVKKPGMPDLYYGKVDTSNIGIILENYLINDNPYSESLIGSGGDEPFDNITPISNMPMFKSQKRIVLRNCGIINPRSIDDYIYHEGYSGFAKALKMEPELIIDQIKEAKLRGRGGAGFPTGIKWELCMKAKSNIKYIICNADEGDPGAFMNRSLLEGDPHSVIEGMLIGAYAIGATKGYIYCRAEKPLAIESIQQAVNQAYEYGLAGNNILDSGFCFDIEVREGAGAFVCGEETALIKSIEGERGMPVARPPYPAERGLWGKPTNINNVETWANVTAIMQKGSQWYSSIGSENSKGTKTFALAGKINHTGLIEVPFGISLRTIIEEIGGGVPDGKKLKAVQIGGPSGGCIPADLIDVNLDYESLPELGAIVGSGGMIVMDEDSCMVDIAKYFMNFIQSESCGKCVPCRIGTRKMLDILEKITAGDGSEGDIELLLELSESVKLGSLCGLGQTSPNPVLTTLRYFKNEYEAHIYDKSCPAMVCNALITYFISPDKCRGCGLCVKNCPVAAISGEKGKVYFINQEMCIKCGSCYDVCPAKFNAVEKLPGRQASTDNYA